jgi:hypothetical protein
MISFELTRVVWPNGRGGKLSIGERRPAGRPAKAGFRLLLITHLYMFDSLNI